ncbi:MAG: DUF4434 domain-containing protein [Bacilli bacterium]|nr:DUF4434 domain-containing protein [Bacilli bacterium]
MKNYPITATFIDEVSIDIPTSNWSKKEWIKDLKAMKSVGIDTIIFIRGGLNGKCIYPSKKFPTFYDESNDFLGYMLDASEKLGINVYVGLYMSNGNWDNGDYNKLKELNAMFIDEVMERYGHHKNLVGWYLPLEVCKVEFNIIESVNALTELIQQKTPNMKVYWCSLFRSKFMVPSDPFTPEQTFEVWDEILSKCGKYVNSIAFNEGTAPLNEYEDYLKAVKRATDKNGVELWANVETFDRDPRHMFYPVQFEILQKKLEISQKYCSKINTFEFSHFMSPNSMYESGKNLFKRYKSFYKNK